MGKDALTNSFTMLPSILKLSWEITIMDVFLNCFLKRESFHHLPAGMAPNLPSSKYDSVILEKHIFRIINNKFHFKLYFL